MAEYNDMQAVKRSFFAMRNGVLADVMRRAGSKFRIIFGLNIPQIAEIAEQWRGNKALAQQLWANRTTRESMLMVPMMVDAARLTDAQLAAMVEDVAAIADTELADIVCHRLIRRRHDADALRRALLDSDSDIKRYMGLRLTLGALGTIDDAEALAAADRESSRGTALTRPLAATIKSTLSDDY